MTTRWLQVMIPEALDARIQEAAELSRMSKGEWVRQALQELLRGGKPCGGKEAVAKLAALNGPAGNMGPMKVFVDLRTNLSRDPLTTY